MTVYGGREVSVVSSFCSIFVQDEDEDGECEKNEGTYIHTSIYIPSSSIIGQTPNFKP